MGSNPIPTAILEGIRLDEDAVLKTVAGNRLGFESLAFRQSATLYPINVRETL
jgi:hypothetical protein